MAQQAHISNLKLDGLAEIIDVYRTQILEVTAHQKSQIDIPPR